MPPNQNQLPTPGPGDPGHDPYAFFMDPQRAPRRNLLSLGGGFGGKLLIAGAALVAIILIFVIANIANSGNKAKQQQLLSLAQTQQEVIRVATDGTRNAQSTNLQDFANTTVLSLSSDQRLLLALITKEGKKISTKQLELGKNPQTDQALAAAQAANTYDTTFATTMDSELGDYQTKLEDTLKGATSTAGINLLKQEIDNASQLRKQVETKTDQ